eukprot:scaffold58732_cov29-Attheya_sp.AAC.1
MCLIESAVDCCHTLPPLIPGKSLVAGFQQILGNGGGFSIFLPPPLPLPQLQVDSSLKRARSMSSESSSPVMKKPARANPESESDLKLKSAVPTLGAPSIADSSHTPNQEPEPGPEIKDPLFGEIDREKREGKATKSDDAEVHVYLWEEHLIDDGEFGWTTEDLPRLRPLIEACKTMMLRWWKRKVTSSFFKWVIKTNPDLELTKHQSVVRYSGSAFKLKDGTMSPSYKWFTSGKQLWFDNWRTWQQK